MCMRSKLPKVSCWITPIMMDESGFEDEEDEETNAEENENE